MRNIIREMLKGIEFIACHPATTFIFGGMFYLWLALTYPQYESIGWNLLGFGLIMQVIWLVLFGRLG